jgi:Ca2+-transporting ATPase
MAFATVALAELLFVFSIRSATAPAWRGEPNPALTWSVAASVALVALLVYVPAFHGPFGTEPLGAVELVLVLALAALPALLLESGKALRRRGLAR